MPGIGGDVMPVARLSDARRSCKAILTAVDAGNPGGSPSTGTCACRAFTTPALSPAANQVRSCAWTATLRSTLYNG